MMFLHVTFWDIPIIVVGGMIAFILGEIGLWLYRLPWKRPKRRVTEGQQSATDG